MRTEVVKVNPLSADLINNINIIKAVNLLKNGELVGMPTETVYGLAANGFSSEAVKKIYKAKGRPSDNPLIYHIADIEMLYTFTENVPVTALKLAERFWAGALTMVFPKKDIIPGEAVCGMDTVAVRMPDNDIALTLIRLCGFPLAAPSANISGSPSPTSAAHVLYDMDGKIPLIIDGGVCNFGVESTVISFENGGGIRILRPGAVTVEMLSDFAEIIIDRAVSKKFSLNDKPVSPGTKYKHYSPKAKVVLVEASNDEVFNHYISEQAEINTKKNVLALIFGSENPPDCSYLTYGKTSAEQAKLLFARLRELDEKKADIVYVRAPEKDGIGLAVYNRLARAAEFNIIILQ